MESDSVVASPPSYKVPLSLEPKKRRVWPRVLLVLCGGLVVIAIALVSSYYYVPSFNLLVQKAVVAEQLPKDLSSAYFVGKGNSFYHLNGWTLEKANSPQFIRSGALSPDGSMLTYSQP